MLVLGTDAAVFAKKSMANIPSVFAMVVNPRDSGLIDEQGKSCENMAGVSLDVPIERQFSFMKEIVPKLKTVGMLYDAESKEWLKNEAQKAADAMGLTLKAVAVKPPYDVESAINNDLKGVDVLWASIDPKIYNANTAKSVLLSTLRMKLPFMAFTSKYVKAGALVALECDYIGVGRQAADIARSVIEGKRPGEIGVLAPVAIETAVNTRTAQLIKLDLSDSVVKLARHVYGESES
jgi:putative ABC transport system substrate-binding protein